MKQTRRVVQKRLTPKVIPPHSVIQLVKADLQTPSWKAKIGTRFRVGYYNPRHGLGEVWLVDEKGVYCDSVEQLVLSKYFKIVRLSNEEDLFGADRPVICPLEKSKSQGKSRNPRARSPKARAAPRERPR